MAEPGRPQRVLQGIAGTWPVGGRTASAGGFVPAGLGFWSSLVGILREWAKAEAGPGRLFPWVPVAFGCGIALYFAADHEPVLWVTVATATALTFGAVLLRRSPWFAAMAAPCWKRPSSSMAALAPQTNTSSAVTYAECWQSRKAGVTRLHYIGDE